MEQDQVYFRSKSGEQALAEPMRLLQHNLRRALALVDGRSTVGQIHVRFGDEAVAAAALADLLRAGLIVPADAPPPPAEAPLPNPDRMEPVGSIPSPAQPPVQTSSLFEEISLNSSDDFDDDEFALDHTPTQVPVGAFGSPLHELPPARPVKPPRRPLRLPLNWRLLGAVAVLSLAAGVTALLVLFPYASFKPLVEVRLGAFLQQPVKIGTMRVTLTPRPNLTLEQVEVGSQGEIRIASAKLIPGLAALLSQREIVFGARLDGVEFGDKGAQLIARGRGGVGNSAWHVDYATFSNLALLIGQTKLDHLQGEISPGADGIELVNVRSEDHAFQLALKGEGDGFHLSVSALDWRAGSLPIRNLDLTATVNGDGLRFTRIDGGLLGGLVSGTLGMGWDGRLQSDLTLTRVDALRLWSLLGLDVPLKGELSGHFRVASEAEDWSLLLDKARVDGNVHVARGELARINLADAVRNGNGAAVRGGMTAFEELGLAFRRNGQNWSLSNIRLSAGSLTAAGAMDVTENGPITGGVQVTLSGKFQAPVNFTGTLKEPVLRSVRRG